MTQDLCGHYLLQEWAGWAGERNLLGFPSRSSTERAWQGGMERGAHSPEGPMPTSISKTDAAVARVRLNSKELWVVIRLVYLNGHSINALSKTMGITRYRAERLLGRAQKNVKLERERGLQPVLATDSVRRVGVDSHLSTYRSA